MSIAKSIQQIMEQSSWIRKMFEEGIELKKIHLLQGKTIKAVCKKRK